MDDNIKDEILSKSSLIPNWFVILFLILFVAGAAAFISQIMGSNASEAWQIFLVNFIFWTGISQAGIIISCILRITDARWARPYLRIAESFGAFTLISFILLIVLFLGKDYILPYATHHYHYPKDVWLNINFVMARDIGGFLILIILSMFYLYFSLRQDLGGLQGRLSGLAAWIASGWKGEEDKKRCWKNLRKFAPIILGVYALTLSLFAWDLMMSLDPYWLSTLFGPYYFMASFVAAIATTIILSVFLRRRLDLFDYINDKQYWDIAKLLQGFSIFWVYLFFSQLLPIWYANMPEESAFVIKRVQEEPYRSISWAVLTFCFIFPFIALLPRTNKIFTPILAFVAGVSIIGFFIEKFVLIMPSLTDKIVFGWVQIAITIGFMSGFLMMFMLFVKSFPIIPFGDPFFGGKNKGHGGH